MKECVQSGVGTSGPLYGIIMCFADSHKVFELVKDWVTLVHSGVSSTGDYLSCFSQMSGFYFIICGSTVAMRGFLPVCTLELCHSCGKEVFSFLSD